MSRYKKEMIQMERMLDTSMWEPSQANQILIDHGGCRLICSYTGCLLDAYSVLHYCETQFVFRLAMD